MSNMSTPTKGANGFEQPHCAACNSPLNDGRAAVCNACRQSYHSSCVGANEGVPFGSWSCPACVNAANRTVDARSVKSGCSTRSTRVRLELLRLEEERLVREKSILERKEQDRLREMQVLKEKEELEMKYIDEKYKILASEVVEDEDRSVDSHRSNAEQQYRVLGWVNKQEPSAEIDEQLDGASGKSENRSLGQRSPGKTGLISDTSMFNNQLNQQMTAPTGPAYPLLNPTRAHEQGWPRWQIAPPQVAPMEKQFAPQQFVPPQQFAPLQQPAVQQQFVPPQPYYCSDPGQQPLWYQPSQWHSTNQPPTQSAPLPVPPPQAQDAAVGRQAGPYRHFAARQVVPKDLPPFDGKLKDWPLFISSYRNSTELCGFSDAENMLRLQKCLHGRAREVVECLLNIPTATAEVLEELEVNFGDPEKLVAALAAKVAKTPAPKADDLKGLTDLGIAVQNLVGFLKSAKQEKHLANPTLLNTLVQKLPPNIRINWGIVKSTTTGDLNLETFNNFLKVISRAAHDVTPYDVEAESSRSSKIDKTKSKDKGFVNVHVLSDSTKKEEGVKTSDSKKKTSGNLSTTDKPCFVCQKTGHRVRECYKFKSFSLIHRWTAVEKHSLCSRCLVPHGKWPCKAVKTCDVSGCSDGHHSLLHPGKPDGAAEHPSCTAVVTVHRQLGNPTLFRIVPVILYGNDKQVQTYAFLDEGSSLTLMETGLANQLGVTGMSKRLCIKWTSGVTHEEPKSMQFSLNISAAEGGERFLLRDVYTMKRLGLPIQTLHYETLARRFPHLRKLPVSSYEGAEPRILIGLNNQGLAMPLKHRMGHDEDPIAIKTKLGWTICGGVKPGSSPTHMFHICECTDDRGLHELVKGFFAVENLGITGRTPLEAAEDVRAKSILRDTTVKLPDGHYETGLLWRYDHVEFPPSYTMAERRLHCLERRLRANPELRDNLDKQIVEYQRKGYAHKATAGEMEAADKKRVWYLPLGVVTNPKKPGKVRIIWDAAATINGVSFNSMLLKGPDMLTSLPSVLFRFRERQFCVTADIKEMYHQVRIREADRSSQRFLYRSDPTQPPETFIMNVATFGSTCSPCSAQYVKNLNAREWEKEFPEAAAAIVENHYVDDYLDSRDTEDEMIKVAKDVRTVHAKAGFEIRNWLSNSEDVLRRVGVDSNAPDQVFIIDKSRKAERVLGTSWQPETDMFSFSVALPEDLQRMVKGDKTVSKRGVLRLVMSLFDPLGFIAHYLIHGKILIQDLWRSGVSWDEPVPVEIFERWERWVGLLTSLPQVQVPRCYFPGYHAESLKAVELHVLVDASEMAYAAAAYFRIVDRGQIRCAFVSSKAKVAPLKFTSIPRMELEATLMGKRLAKMIVKSHSFTVTRTVIWTDSTTVLAWIRSDTRRYKQYVAVRLADLLEDTDVDNFRWVPTKLNVADEATKWGRGPNLEPTARWFTGPEFLFQPEADWPQQKVPPSEPCEELRAVHVHHEERLEEHHEERPVEIIDCSRFGKWEHLLRTMAYVYHFADQCRAPPGQRNAALTPEDYIRAERALWRQAQIAGFADDYDVLASNLPARKTGPLRKLSPFLDEHEVIRMEGRIRASPFADYDAKYPIILPKGHAVTALLIDWYHRKQGHAFGETVVNQMRQRFHISNLRVMTRNAKKWCQWCKVHKATPDVPRMGPLPEVRVTAHERVFTRVGIDYFGPMMIKIGRAQVKRWVALFTCLASRAVHLEVVASLSTDSCKMAIRRFIGRRGAPAEIYTDNGTNFLGTSRELEQQISAVEAELAETFTNANTKWNFIPPCAPHMGGVWERMVRSVKTAMMSLSSLGTPTEEVFQTVVIEAESMINSRPLTYMPLETSDEEAITPNHLILLSSHGVKQPVKEPTSAAEALRSGYHLGQRMLDHFWSRWIREYLPTITRRTKWFTDVKPVEVGDIVIIVDDKARNRWARGRVVRLIPGTDGRVRQADVQTGDGRVCLRAIAKLAVLDVARNSNAGGPQQRDGSGNVGAQRAAAHDQQQPGSSPPENIAVLDDPQRCQSGVRDDTSDSACHNK